MNNPQFNSYCFKHRAHWDAGASENLHITDGNGLAVLAGFGVETVINTGPEDNTPALDFGPCNHLYWVRTDGKKLLRLRDFGAQIIGTLSEAKGATQLAVGAERLWLLTKNRICGGLAETTDAFYRINSYSIDNLHPLRQLNSQGPILDITGDGDDGVWWLEGGDKDSAVLYHADRYGCQVSPPLPLRTPLLRAAMAVTSCRRKIVILDPEATKADIAAASCAGENAHWRLIIVNCTDGATLIHDDIGVIAHAFKPELLAIDNKQLIHLLDSRPHPHTAQIWTLNLDGALIARRRLQLPQDSLPISAISAGDHITVSTPLGIAHLRSTESTLRQGDERKSTFITPTLISPDGTPRGWQRANIDVVLPEGTTLEVTCAATRDANQANAINRVLQDNNHTPAFKLAQLDERLSWRSDDRVIYTGNDQDNASVRLSYPLHQVDQNYLWLRFTFYTPPGRRPPSLKRLSVNYPNVSFLRYLPAVYQEDTASAAALQRFLAIFETLFDDLDTAIDQLPSYIDPDTAPASWLPFLLRWLGLPSSEALGATVQRVLLKEAPELLAERGTVSALQRLLEIIGNEQDEVNIQIDDSATGPTPWVLQGRERQSLAPRLGRDTLIVSQNPTAFCLGASRLGSSMGVPLGIGYADPKRIFTRRSGELRIRIEAETAVRERLEPIIRIFLPYFVPAHCHYTLKLAAPAPQTWHQHLDVDLRLMDRTSFRLGSETVLGRFQLPLTSTDEIILDHGSHLDRGLHLN